MLSLSSSSYRIGNCQYGSWKEVTKKPNGHTITDLCFVAGMGGTSALANAHCNNYCTGSASGEWVSLVGFDIDDGGGAAIRDLSSNQLHSTSSHRGTLCVKKITN